MESKEQMSFSEELANFATRLSDAMLKDSKKEALDAYEGLLWRVHDYLTQKNREYKQASMEGMVKDIAEMVKIGKDLALFADTDEDKQFWMLKTDRNIGQQLRYCSEWLDRLGVEHQTWEEYIKDPLGFNK